MFNFFPVRLFGLQGRCCAYRAAVAALPLKPAIKGALHQIALGEAGYHVVAPDQRGYSPGARPSDVSDYALAEIAADAVAMATLYTAAQ